MKSSSKFSCIVPTTASQLCLPSDAPCYNKQPACHGCLQAYGPMSWMAAGALWECISPTHWSHTMVFQHLLWDLFSNCSALDVVVDRRSKWNKRESVSQWFSGRFKWSVVYLLLFFVLQISILHLCRCSFDGLQKCQIDNNARLTQKSTKICSTWETMNLNVLQ